ncbi:hypothetical protein [Kribbella sp. NPDC051770]|uniref:hypothetical protein n=1 Tax=Kribbella sp. NPDC051770 TaxID=3155413 RepID=UPI00343976D8
MPLDAQVFTMAFARARERLEQAGDVAAEQAQLRALVPDDSSDEDKQWTAILIERLGKPPAAAPPRSALFEEAASIHAEAFTAEGDPDAKIAAAREARRRIFALAEQADEAEAADIRAMTRPLEHWENDLLDPPWPIEGSPGQDG